MQLGLVKEGFRPATHAAFGDHSILPLMIARAESNDFGVTLCTKTTP
jgi:hypothetical protein